MVQSVQTKGLTVLLTEEGGAWVDKLSVPWLGWGDLLGGAGPEVERERESSDPDCRVEVLVGITVVNAG